MLKGCVYVGLVATVPLTATLMLQRMPSVPGAQRWLPWMVMMAFAVAYLSTPLAGRIAQRLGAIDKPGGRKIHPKPTPLLGGAAIYLAFASAVLMAGGLSSKTLGVFVTVSLIFVLGLIEDVRGVPALGRLFVQMVAVCVLVRAGVVLTFLPPTGWGVAGEWALTFLWVVGITNAFNFLDGLDGLAAGSAAVNAFFFGVYAFATGQGSLALLSFALMGACLGFLPHNYKPHQRQGEADIFLGDSGSTLLGCTLASLAVLGDWAEASSKDLIVPVLIMAIPIFDMVLITVMRFREGLVSNLLEWIVYAGRDHFHHRLLGLGIRKKEAVAIIYLANICLGISAFLLKGSAATDALLVLVQVSIIFAIIGYAMVVMKKRRAGREFTGQVALQEVDETGEKTPRQKPLVKVHLS